MNKMKVEANWGNKTLENLEKNIWPSLNNDEGSYLIKTCNALRKKQLKDFSIEELRVMIGQDIGLEYLIPMAIVVLEKDILAEGDLYEGDLLTSVLTSEKSFWKKSTDLWKITCELFEKNTQTLRDFETTWEIRKKWFECYLVFKANGQ